jgi:hypothetical protein
MTGIGTQLFAILKQAAFTAEPLMMATKGQNIKGQINN